MRQVFKVTKVKVFVMNELLKKFAFVSIQQYEIMQTRNIRFYLCMPRCVFTSGAQLVLARVPQCRALPSLSPTSFSPKECHSHSTLRLIELRTRKSKSAGKMTSK